MDPQNSSYALVSRRKKLIGWRERVNLPDFGITGIKVKVDSGARTSALHATSIRYLRRADGDTWVSFLVKTSQQESHPHRVRARLLEKRKVKSSLGHVTSRPVIITRIEMGEQIWEAEVTLVNRDPMGFRMLLGRQAIRGRFLIHPARSFIQSQKDSV